MAADQTGRRLVQMEMQKDGGEVGRVCDVRISQVHTCSALPSVTGLQAAAGRLDPASEQLAEQTERVSESFTRQR
ncbi:hypothetical protein AOLI_G00311350 [Acnodon oligacanthus]